MSGLIGLLSPYRWMFAVAVSLALLTGAYIKGEKDEHSKAIAQALAVAQEASRMEQKRASLQQETLNAKDAQLRLINRRLANALVQLRNRPERLPEPARAACEGATGRELSRADAEFLERLAARADALRAELHAYQDREHGAVTE